MSITYDYTSVYPSTSGGGLGLLGAIGGMLVFLSVIMFAMMIAVIIAQFKIFKKVGLPAWYALIPIFNMWKLFEVVNLPGWLCIVPFVNALAMLYCYYKLALSFGKSKTFAILTVIFPAICLIILGFDKSTFDANGQTENSSSNVQTNGDALINNQTTNNTISGTFNINNDFTQTQNMFVDNNNNQNTFVDNNNNQNF